jgi:diguanylate cyclase (GGDEF)-like protein
MSTSLLFENELVGVVSLYSAEPNGFNDDHKRVIEVVAGQLAPILKSATEFDSTSRRDTLTGLPNLKRLEQFVDAAGVKRLVQEPTFALLFIDVVDLEQINAIHGRAVGDDLLLHVVRHATAGLRLADILFRYGSDGFVALLSDTNSESARLVAGRIREGIRTNPLKVGGESIQVEVSVTAASSPTDGETLPSLLESARSRATDLSVAHESPSTH